MHTGVDHHLDTIALRLIPLEALDLLDAGDLDSAGELMNLRLPQFFLDEKRLWNIRSEQIRDQPEDAPWLARAVQRQPDGVVVGYAGFHGPPNDAGMVEIGYTIGPEYRRNGYGRATAFELLKEAGCSDKIRVVRASVSPENSASLKMVESLGFVRVGEQWDEEDGLEFVFERPPMRSPPGA